MKKTLLALTLTALVAGFAAPNADAGNKPAPGPQMTPLRVTIEPYDDLGAPCAILGDGADYVNGVDGVMANFETDGNLAIRGIGPDGTPRRVHYNFGAPLAGYPNLAFTPSDPNFAVTPSDADASYNLAADYFYVLTALTDGVAIQNMLIGTTKCIRVSNTFEAVNDNTRYRMTYQRTTATGIAPAADGTDQDGTAWGLITRVDAGTWTLVVGAGSCSPTAGLPPDGPAAARVIEMETVTANHKTTTTTYNRGRFNMPFKLTLRTL